MNSKFCKKKKHNPRFCITFHVDDFQLANNIKEFIGFGFIRKKIRQNAVVLVISNENGLLKIIDLFSNNFYTPKVIQFNKLLIWFNINKNFNFNINKINNNDLLFNYWFSGFVEADGCFYIRMTQAPHKSRIAFRFSIDQRMFDPITNESYYNILKNICDTFVIKLKTINRKNNKSYYRIETVRKDSLLKLIIYFDKYKLIGKKKLDYDSWKEAFFVYNNCNKLNDEIINKIKELKSNMNRSRKITLL